MSGRSIAFLDGVIDSRRRPHLFDYSLGAYIWADMNGDKDFSGSIALKYRYRFSGEEGVRLGEADGQLYIDNASTNIAIQDPWIEDDVNWGDGGYKSTAFAVELNDNGTSIDTDDYYQLAVKQVNTWTDVWGSGGIQKDVNWQVYAIDAEGRIDWDKTIWTQSIAGFETFFDEDLNGDEIKGVDASKFEFAPLDTYGHRLKKDKDNYLYIVDENGDNLVSVKDEYGGYPSFDHSYSYWGGSHISTAVAVEQNPDLSFSLAVKHVDTWDGNSNTSWEIINISKDGLLSWEDMQWVEDISLLETTLFGDDLDEDGSKGLNLASLSIVETDLESSNGRLYTNAEKDRYYIQDRDLTLGITHEWGGWIDLSAMRLGRITIPSLVSSCC